MRSKPAARRSTISHAGEGATSDAQTTIFDALKAEYPADPFQRLRLWMAFPDGFVRHPAARRPRAAGSFLFFALARSAAAGSRAVHAEGAREWPDRGQRAARSPPSRRAEHTHHPPVLHRSLERCAHRSEYRRPHRESLLDKTKGEMVAACANDALLRRLTPISVLCGPHQGTLAGPRARSTADIACRV